MVMIKDDVSGDDYDYGNEIAPIAVHLRSSLVTPSLKVTNDYKKNRFVCEIKRVIAILAGDL